MTTKLNKEETGGVIITAEDQNFATRLYHGQYYQRCHHPYESYAECVANTFGEIFLPRTS